jgi:glycosyltransferase involved in cell wall biosynthesis
MIQTLDRSSGGVASAVIALSKGLAQYGQEVEIVSLDDPTAPSIADLGLPVHALGRGLTSYEYSPKLVPWLVANAARFDRVVVNGIWQYMSFAAWRVFADGPVPYYVFPHGMLDPWFKRTFPLKHLKKWLSWPWGDYRVLRDAAAVIFTAEEEKIAARESFWLYQCNERVSPLGIAAPQPGDVGAKEAFLARFPQLNDRRILLFLGRLHPKKGCDMLIEAFPRDQLGERPLALVLAGPDQIGWEQTLRNRATHLNPSVPIVFTGMLEGELKRGAIAAADAFILPSHQDNFGMAVAEALAAGVPVLISNKVNVWREIDADGAGYVESDDLAGTIHLIERWLRTSEEVRERMRENARRCFAARFEITHAAGLLLQILSEPAR